MRLRLSGRAPPPVIIAVPLAGQGSGAGNAGDGAASLKGTWQRRFDPKMESCVGYILTAGASMAPLLEPVLDLAIIFECRDDEGSGVRAKVGHFCYRGKRSSRDVRLQNKSRILYPERSQEANDALSTFYWNKEISASRLPCLLCQGSRSPNYITKTSSYNVGNTNNQ